MKRISIVPTVFVVLSVCGAWPAAEAESSAQTATHQEKESIGTTKETQFGALSSFCLNSEGKLLCCDAKATEIRWQHIRNYSQHPSGRLR
ncbi:MAG: hypothetical protein ISS78_01055 [Phycisphaerae bacterium]|nr:hypothetical protein [Phycisphaerae bacterium]